MGLYHTMYVLCFPDGTRGKEPTCQCWKCKKLRFNPWVRKIPGEGNGNPLQRSFLENPMDRGAWLATVHGATKHQTQVSTEHTCAMKIRDVNQ